MNENTNIDITMNIKNEIKSNDVVLFMKGTPAFPMCGFSAAVAQILNNMGVRFNSINVLDNEKMREGIKKLFELANNTSAVCKRRIYWWLRYCKRNE